MNYRSISDLNHSIRANILRIPPDVDIVVGIPRSGMLPATLIALYLELPLSDLDGFLRGNVFETGLTRRNSVNFSESGDYKKILVVDDSIITGSNLAHVKKKRAKVARISHNARM